MSLGISLKTGDVVVHAEYGMGSVKEVRRAGREANVEFHIGILTLCPTSELRLLGTDAARNDISQTMSTWTGPPESALPTATDTLTVPATPDQELIAPSPAGGSLEIGPNGSGSGLRIGDPATSTSRPLAPEQVAAVQILGPNIGADEQFQSRQVVEALRLGIVPRFRINELTIGLRSERSSARAALDETEKYGGDVRAVIGEYGTGKTHFFEWTATEALNRGYLVATASLDVWETPPSKPFSIFYALTKSLRYPDHNDRGSLAGLFERLVTTVGIDAVRKALSAFHKLLDRCPLYDALRSYARYRKDGDEERTALILSWIAGERLPVWSLNRAKIQTADTLRKFTTVADQYCYLLNGIAWFARLAGYKGLVVLVDESEHYSLLSTTMKERADVFFQGMIYSALGDRQKRVPVCPQNHHGSFCGLRHGGTQPYPFFYSQDSGLLFMFAATTSAIALDYTAWLEPDKIIRLDNRQSPGEIEELLARIYVFHRKAFEYDRTANFADTSAELISLYENGHLNLRELIRVSTEAFDLIYTYPGYVPRLEG